MRKIQYKVENLNAMLNMKDPNVEMWVTIKSLLSICCFFRRLLIMFIMKCIKYIQN